MAPILSRAWFLDWWWNRRQIDHGPDVRLAGHVLVVSCHPRQYTTGHKGLRQLAEVAHHSAYAGNNVNNWFDPASKVTSQ